MSVTQLDVSCCASNAPGPDDNHGLAFCNLLRLIHVSKIYCLLMDNWINGSKKAKRYNLALKSVLINCTICIHAHHPLPLPKQPSIKRELFSKIIKVKRYKRKSELN
jgi:hypothetical protein